MKDGFRIKYNGHELRARKLLLKQGLKAAFEAVDCGEDWLLVLRDKLAEFNALITWVER